MDGEFSLTPAAPNLSERVLPELPEVIAAYAAIDREKLEILVEAKMRGNPLVLTWIDKCRAVGFKFRVVPTQLDEILIAQKVFAHGTKSLTTPEEAALEHREAALRMLKLGADYRASDIHIMLRGSHAEVQFRIKGELRTATWLKQAEGEAICRAFYQGIAAAKDNSYTPLDVQHGQISGPVLREMGLTSVRIVRGPSYPEEDGGGFMILRLQYPEMRIEVLRTEQLPQLQKPRTPEGAFNLEGRGYTKAQSDRLRFILEGSSGLTLYMGPTGCGKTTAIFELLKELARRAPGKRIISIEDPIEYPMPFAIQLVITNALESGVAIDKFAEFLKNSLRMDPDTIFLGELRSAEACLAAFQAALTGHRVPSTLHVTEPFTFADRIELMDPTRLNRRMFCNSKIVRGLVNQRLVPHICPDCSARLSYRNESLLDTRLLSSLKTYGNLADVRLRGEGCTTCHGDGILSRSAVAEVIATDVDLMKDIIEHGSDVARRNFRARGDTDDSVLSLTMDRVLRGEVDPRDVGEAVDVVVDEVMVNA